MPHVLIYILWCLVPALILLPLRILDREPRNEVTQDQPDEEDGRGRDDGPGGLLAAA